MLLRTFFFFALSLIIVAAQDRPDSKRPNVVLLLADDLGWQDLRCYGGPVKTPALDRLAGDGVRFTRFYAGAAVCSPSRATLLTGRHHVRSGLYSWIDDNTQATHLPESEITLAEHLREAGYRTGHFGKWHLGLRSQTQEKPDPAAHGFDHWFATRNGAGPSHRDPQNFLRNGAKVGPLKGYSCHLVAEEAMGWMERQVAADPDRPFFLNLWFHEPHATLAAPAELVREYDGPPQAALYSATIDNLDRAVERILDRLQQLGLRENTLVMFSSDNGSYRVDRVGGLRGTKGSNYEGGIRVPGIFSWPGTLPSRREIAEPAGQLDLLPTICGLAGIPLPKGRTLDGTDLSPLLLGQQERLERDRPLAWILPLSGNPLALREGPWSLIGYRDQEYPKDRKAMAALRQKIVEVLRADGDPDPAATVTALIHEGFKNREADKLRGQYIRLNQFQESWIPAIKAMPYERFELFHLERDPKQQRDVASEHPAVFERLKQTLLTLNREVMAKAPDWGQAGKQPLAPPEPKPVPQPKMNRILAPLEGSLTPLLEASCLDCHDAETKTPLNLEALAFALEEPHIHRTWEKVYDAISSGSMPPPDKPRPDPVLLNSARDALASHLLDSNVRQQKKYGRAAARRLTAREYEHTVQDLFDLRTPLVELLPLESDATTFDTIATGQEMAPLHIRSYLAAADAVLDDLIELGPRPNQRPRKIDYRNHPYIKMWLDRDLRRGGNAVLRTEDAFVTFDLRPHSTQSDNMGLRFKVPGAYRITAEAFAYQAKTPVTFCLYRCNDLEGRRDLIATRELKPGRTEKVVWTRQFRPGDYFYIAPADHDRGPSGAALFQLSENKQSRVGAKNYDGEGLGIRSMKIEGPLEIEWPPSRTRALFGKEMGYELGAKGVRLKPSKNPRAHVADTVKRFGSQLFRRSLDEKEVESWVRLADPALTENRGIVEGIRCVLRGMLCAPDFLYQSSEPGPLLGAALATRLSLFLWKSLPDETLHQRAAQGQLVEPAGLRVETTRLLADPRGRRFIEDFSDQWLRLDEIDATTPSAKLFPEYDDVLRQAMLEETYQFIADAFRNNRPIRVLIDADYTFANRRLAQHYGIPNVDGLEFRRVQLPTGSRRGGLLTQASILKVTANGTNTSPVPRGNFVLRRLLGQEMPPPPPDAGTVEPDTRGTTTIRETLAAHRDVASCNRCHQEIDPPGFALEQFDPIGGFRTRYRSTGAGDRPTTQLLGRSVFEYKLGPAVDASGVTADGQPFGGIREFKRLLLREQDTVARHLTEQLLAYATGAEMQFADRSIVDAILREAKPDGYRLGDLLHAIIQSPLFRNK